MTDLLALADKLDLLADKRAQCASVRLHTGGVAEIAADLCAYADGLQRIARTLKIAAALAAHEQAQAQDHENASIDHKEW